MNPKKKHILDAAQRLFVEKGYLQTAVQDILDEAGVAKGTFYKYFVSKNECLTTILHNIWEEGNQKRHELARGKSADDVDVFAQQLNVRMHMSHEYNLIALIESISFSQDTEMKAFIKRQHAEELLWAARRIEEVYTPGVKAYALDQAVMLLGIIHHFMHIAKLGQEESIDELKIIRFSLNRLEAVIEEQKRTGTRLLSENWLSHMVGDVCPSDCQAAAASELSRLEEELAKKGEQGTKRMEFVRFLQNEIKMEAPRVYLIESVLYSTSYAFEGTAYESASTRALQLVWKWVEQLEG